MTIKELSEKCGISEQSLRAWCKKNNVPKTIIEGNERKATKEKIHLNKAYRQNRLFMLEQ